ncbi:MAG TPA: bifunctional diguanylate cyclase/phosphodiesterase [Pilimelia sp.]|nr:bifunctional diguanylate cyclase/phosphodiesterase [Pilimelia sp.]
MRLPRSGCEGVGVAAVLTAACAVWLVVGVTAEPPVGRARSLAWTVAGLAPAVATVALAAWASLRAARASAAPAARRFWFQLAAAITALGAGGALHARTVLGRLAALGPDAMFTPGLQRVSIPTLSCYGAALLVLLWALLRLPGRAALSRHSRNRFVMDTAIVMITTGLLVWYFSFRRLTDWEQVGPTVPSLTIVLLAFIGTFAFVKIVLLGAGAVELGAARRLAWAVGIGGLAGAASPLLLAYPHVVTSVLALPPVALLVCAAAGRQRRHGGSPPPPAPPRRLYSVVPYLAVACADALLLFTAVSGDSTGTRGVVAVGAVVLTAVVVLRQITALNENARLLHRVDATVRELRDAQSQLAHQAQHDALTGLANRRLFEQRLQALDPAAGPACVVLIDLDDFKVINDRLGHLTGDALLVAVGKRLRGCVRGGDTVARLGGDEFALILHGLTATASGEVLDRIGQTLDRPVTVDGLDLLVRSSIGVAEADERLGANELLRRADLAMYAAKARGKGRRERYDTRLDVQATTDAQLGADLRRGLDEGEFTLLFQPIVRLPDGVAVGAEALVRWRHPHQGLVPPDLFIAAAERTGLIVPLGDWVLREALGQAAGWLERDGATQPWKVSVNISARQLREPEFPQSVADALRRSGLPAGRLMLEVTETAVFDNDVAVDALTAVTTLGVSVALDDFGTGHSSLGLLRTTPVDVLKVDKSFVDGVPGSDEETIIARAMLQIAEGLKLGTIVEGVESWAQAQCLHELGYRHAQGYHFARPLPAADVGALLRAACPAHTGVG